MKCPKCQFENRENAIFCRRCGSSLAQDLVCPNCSTKNPSDSLFCESCGQPLGETVQKEHEPSNELATDPTTFANDRYQIKEVLGEGAKRRLIGLIQIDQIAYFDV